MAMEEVKFVEGPLGKLWVYREGEEHFVHRAGDSVDAQLGSREEAEAYARKRVGLPALSEWKSWLPDRARIPKAALLKLATFARRASSGEDVTIGVEADREIRATYRSDERGQYVDLEIRLKEGR